MDIIKKVADKFTDTFQEEISHYLVAYGLDATDENINKVIKQIINIYNK